ncbi:hypothetical protein J2Z83_002174 [Virgibacillus natechei]|uniref:Uncharacterized protein n=1 Tax=Virgibacillus natechei TaxID=1216297 RepID=A0ABS4IGQ8_9BACI|nr:hypothetical protein [Virgibacillus natechei]MBP1970058.1 hypothetical protein [Virgibacillus natechei]UZD14142.1 hypothetical protein OLD84_06380 [Virgibacillus natechei]
MMQRNIEKFDDAFPNSVFAIPSAPEDHCVKVGAMIGYCRANGVKLQDLTDEEKEQFIR